MNRNATTKTKLGLARETVRRLGTAELGRAVGGTDNQYRPWSQNGCWYELPDPDEVGDPTTMIIGRWRLP